MNADLGDLDEVISDSYQVGKSTNIRPTKQITTGRPPIGSGRPPKQIKEVRKSQESSSVLSRIAKEKEKSKSILEQQRIQDQKRQQLSLDQALSNGAQIAKNSPIRSPTKAKEAAAEYLQRANIPRSLVEPVNKATPFDKEKSEACQDLVKRLRMEKKAR